MGGGRVCQPNASPHCNSSQQRACSYDGPIHKVRIMSAGTCPFGYRFNRMLDHYLKLAGTKLPPP
jgi:hypothetical protein